MPWIPWSRPGFTQAYSAPLNNTLLMPWPQLPSVSCSFQGAASPRCWDSHWPLAKLADIYIERCYITRKRIGSWWEWILTNQGTGKSPCGTVIDAFGREINFTLNKRVRLYLFLSKWHQKTGSITAGTYSKSGVFRIQLTCSMGLSLRADSSQTGVQNLSADESIRPMT